MLCFSTWVINLLILFQTTLAQDSVWLDKLHHNVSYDRVNTSRTGRFGFDFLENLRQSFCNSSCTSADSMPYIVNFLCAVKCPELYLPHRSTTPKTPISTITSGSSTITTTAVTAAMTTKTETPSTKLTTTITPGSPMTSSSESTSMSSTTMTTKTETPSTKLTTPITPGPQMTSSSESTSMSPTPMTSTMTT
ncbi:uncharacterized protein [Anoplolepis gracilipes]|uniref:uncharacterized protein isoform X2 n=1 Tax=Anoplolepis gracilipes TaxID=354296 RepID=UPI003B9F3B37